MSKNYVDEGPLREFLLTQQAFDGAIADFGFVGMAYDDMMKIIMKTSGTKYKTFFATACGYN